MQIFFPKEEAHEIRATILPEVAKKFIDLGIDISIEAGLGESVFISDELYAEAGAKISTDRNASFSAADVVCKLNKPNKDEIQFLKKDSQKKMKHSLFYD